MNSCDSEAYKDDYVFFTVFFLRIQVQQVTSVMLSSMVLGSNLTMSQWMSCGVVFGSLITRNLVRLFYGVIPDKAPSIPSVEEGLDRAASQGRRANGGASGPSGFDARPRSPEDIRINVGQSSVTSKTV